MSKEYELTPDTIFMAADALILQHVGDELALLDTNTKVSHFMNRTAREVFSMCDGHHTVADIVGAMNENYPSMISDVPEDVRKTLSQMLDLDLIQEVSDGKRPR